MTMMDKSVAEKNLKSLLLDGMPIIEIEAKHHPLEKDWYSKYLTVRKRFLESLSEHIETLIFLNLSQDEFMDLIMGRKTPENLSVRFRIPLQWGGKIEIDNMFLCRTFNESNNIDQFILEQFGNTKIWLPNPTKPVYYPTKAPGTAAGGNSSEEITNQEMMNQMNNSRDR